MKKKIVSLMLASAMLASVFTGCSFGGHEEAIEKNAYKFMKAATDADKDKIDKCVTKYAKEKNEEFLESFNSENFNSSMSYQLEAVGDSLASQLGDTSNKHELSDESKKSIEELSKQISKDYIKSFEIKKVEENKDKKTAVVEVKAKFGYTEDEVRNLFDEDELAEYAESLVTKNQDKYISYIQNGEVDKLVDEYLGEYVPGAIKKIQDRFSKCKGETKTLYLEMKPSDDKQENWKVDLVKEKKLKSSKSSK